MSNNHYQAPDLLDKFAAYRKERAATASNREVNRTLKKNNPNTTADEIRVALYIVLGLSTAFVAYTSFLFFRDLFKPYGPFAASLSAAAVTTITAIGTVWLSHLTLRGFFFRWAFRGWMLGFYLFALLLSVTLFVVSFIVSTDGAKMLAANLTDEQTRGATLSERITEATAAVDAQIEAAQGAQANAQGLKTKKGRTTWQGQLTADKQAQQLIALQGQRQTIVDAVTADYTKGEGKREGKITSVASWVGKYGGIAELLIVLCILAITFAERHLYDENLALEFAEAQKKEQMETTFR